MIEHQRVIKKKKKDKKGRGLLNKIINSLPFELHVPQYNYCGPGTKLDKRLARGDRGINPLDEHCREHDISYAKNPDNLEERHKADKILADKAWQRVFAKDSSLSEKAVAWGVTTAMNLKTKLGMGLKNIKKNKKIHHKIKKKKLLKKDKEKIIIKRKNKKNLTSLKKIIDISKKSIKPGITDPIKTILGGARDAVKKVGGKKKIRLPRILPLPLNNKNNSDGSILPFLIPLFAGLSASGAMTGGAATISKTINVVQAAKKLLRENQRHNRKMESIVLGKGLFLSPYKKGLGLFLNPATNLKKKKNL